MHMGALAVLLCVTVLCVAVFGALTLVTAAGDLRMARRTSYKTPSAKPVSTDTASCASWSETSTCIQPKSFCQKPPEGALSS